MLSVTTRSIRRLVRFLRETSLMKRVTLGVIAVLMLAAALAPGNEAMAQSTARVEVRVWQSVSDDRGIYVSARPAGGSWATLGTIPLDLDGLSSSRAYRYGDIAIEAPLSDEPDAPRATVEVRVWQKVADGRAIYVSARPAGGSWATLGTIPLDLDGLSSSRAYRYGDIAVDVPLANEPMPPSSGMQSSDCRFEDAAMKVIGATVRVITDRGAGTAFYTGDSQFVTAAHVVEGAREVRLRSSGMDAPARVLGTHDIADIAILSAPAGALEPLDFAAPGAIRTNARPGTAVAAAGYADGMAEDAAITRGIVSRLFTRASVSWLQTDAALSPGASGGPLFDTCGRVVGVISSKVISEGVEGVGFGVAEPSLGQVLLGIRNGMRYGPGPDWEQIDAFVKNFGDEQRRVLFESINALMEQWNDVWPTETRPSERLAGIARAQHALATQAWTFVQAIPAAYPLALTNEVVERWFQAASGYLAAIIAEAEAAEAYALARGDYETLQRRAMATRLALAESDRKRCALAELQGYATWAHRDGTPCTARESASAATRP